MRVRNLTMVLSFTVAAACAATPAAPPPGELVVPTYAAPAPLALTATTQREYTVPEADQGVAVDSRYFYAVDNSVIAKYELTTGRLIARWVGPDHGLIRHLNSCLADAGKLWCANSNYSLTPMGSSVEVFDAASMQHVDTHSLGMTDEGSLTWFDHYKDGWIAGFAHYTGNGGLAFKDHTFSNVVTFDAQWRRTGGWLFPADTVERLAPDAASGGAIGPDGLLYILGHDRPEMYVLARPSMGPTLLHVATINLQAEGQAFSFASGRTILTIDRKIGAVRIIELPAVDLHSFPDARSFR
jgi:hypothetical protein